MEKMEDEKVLLHRMAGRTVPAPISMTATRRPLATASHSHVEKRFWGRELLIIEKKNHADKCDGLTRCSSQRRAFHRRSPKRRTLGRARWAHRHRKFSQRECSICRFGGYGGLVIRYRCARHFGRDSSGAKKELGSHSIC